MTTDVTPTLSEQPNRRQRVDQLASDEWKNLPNTKRQALRAADGDASAMDDIDVVLALDAMKALVSDGLMKATGLGVTPWGQLVLQAAGRLSA